MRRERSTGVVWSNVWYLLLVVDPMLAYNFSITCLFCCHGVMADEKFSACYYWGECIHFFIVYLLLNNIIYT